jgi:UPF0716 protein FxsA
VAQVIGGWETIALLVVESAVGAWLLKRQGLSVLQKVAGAGDEGRVPGKEMVDGLLLVVAGALMLAPGFVGDVIGFLLILPPTRAIARVPLMRKFSKGGFARFGSMFAGSAGGPAGTRFVGTFRVRSAGDVIDVQGREPNDRPRLQP